jgi:endonuclease/exonuclease/phosphatase (EEP) superfamily protein YafD
VRPPSRHFLDRLAHLGGWLWIGTVLAATAALWILSDVWWPATVLLFGPRWVLLVPGALLLVWAAFRDRRLLLVLGATALVGLGPLLGTETGWRSFLPSGEGPTLRIATLNARGGEGLPSLDRLLDEWDADVALFQECGGSLEGQIRTLAAEEVPLHAHAEGSLCLVSRFELLETREMDRTAFEFARGSALVQSYLLRWGADSVHITNVHLETQRAGLRLILRRQIRAAAARMRERSVVRTAEHRATRRWADALGGPSIVAGDFNTPPESRAYRAAWDDWTNAFTERGRGIGGTRLNGWIRARIDHILVDDAWRVVSAETGRDVGSDHLPVLATVRLR